MITEWLKYLNYYFCWIFVYGIISDLLYFYFKLTTNTIRISAYNDFYIILHDYLL